MAASIKTSVSIESRDNRITASATVICNIRIFNKQTSQDLLVFTVILELAESIAF